MGTGRLKLKVQEILHPRFLRDSTRNALHEANTRQNGNNHGSCQYRKGVNLRIFKQMDKEFLCACQAVL